MKDKGNKALDSKFPAESHLLTTAASLHYAPLWQILAPESHT
jgi:hypothetical protein